MTAAAVDVGAAAGHGGTLTGTATLVRFMLGRDRIRIIAWVAGLALFTVVAASSFTQSYPTASERQAAAIATDTPAMIATLGVNHGGVAGYTYGAMVGQQMLAWTAMLAALMSVLLFVRNTRAEEATGRAELVRGNVVGRHAATVAALTVVAVANVVLALLMAAGLGSSGIDSLTWSGSLLYGAAHVAVGLTFAGIAAVTVQVTEYTRGASGMALALIGLAYALRAIGDVGDGTLSWLSPIGWAQATQMYVNDLWWPLLLALPTTIVLVSTAFALSLRRDIGAGLRPPRPGTPVASSALANPFGFALRLHRANLIGWVIGMFMLGASYGSVLAAEGTITSNENFASMIESIGGASLAETFLALITTIMAIITAIYAVLAAQRMRSEEVAGRVEPVLATGLSRPRWIASHLAITMVGSVVVLLAGALGLGVTAASAVGDSSLLPAALGSALAYAPALWITVGVMIVLYGLAPRIIGLTWAVVVYGFIVSYFGPLFQLPEWMSTFSPFSQIPRLPVDDFTATPLLVLTAITAGLVTVGLLAFRHRDLQSPA
jgi:ABC-2 type transport system permease protein